MTSRDSTNWPALGEDIIDEAQVIASASIMSLEFGKIRPGTNRSSLVFGSEGSLSSDDFVSGTSGIFISGATSEFNNVVIRGSLVTGAGAGANDPYIGINDDGDNSHINFYSDDTDEYAPSFVQSMIGGSGTSKYLGLYLSGGAWDVSDAEPYVQLRSDTKDSTIPAGIHIGIAGAEELIVGSWNGGDSIRFQTNGETTQYLNGQWRFPDGTVSLPALAFANATNYGTYYTTGLINVSVAGTKVLGIAAGQLRMADGSEAAPAYSFTSGTGYGMFYETSALAFATNGQTRFYQGGYEIVAAGGTLTADYTGGWFKIPDGTAALPGLMFGNDVDTGLYRSSNNLIGVTAGNSTKLLIGTHVRVQTSGTQLRIQDGTTNAPGLAFDGDPDTGIYQVAGAGTLSITANNSEKLRFTSTRANFNQGGIDFITLPVKSTTGDPSSPANGDMYVNTFDNKVRVYADGAWRDLATW